MAGLRCNVSVAGRRLLRPPQTENAFARDRTSDPGTSICGPLRRKLCDYFVLRNRISDRPSAAGGGRRWLTASSFLQRAPSGETGFVLGTESQGAPGNHSPTEGLLCWHTAEFRHNSLSSGHQFPAGSLETFARDSLWRNHFVRGTCPAHRKSQCVSRGGIGERFESHSHHHSVSPGNRE